MKHFITSLAMVAAIAAGTGLDFSADDVADQALQGQIDLLRQMMADFRYLQSDVKKLEDFKALVDAGLVKTGHADITSFMDDQHTSLESLEAEVDVLDAKQITEDFYYVNNDTITM